VRTAIGHLPAPEAAAPPPLGPEAMAAPTIEWLTAAGSTLYWPD
jgi:hypothetical protein